MRVCGWWKYVGAKGWFEMVYVATRVGERVTCCEEWEQWSGRRGERRAAVPPHFNHRHFPLGPAPFHHRTGVTSENHLDFIQVALTLVFFSSDVHIDIEVVSSGSSELDVGVLPSLRPFLD